MMSFHLAPVFASLFCFLFYNHVMWALVQSRIYMRDLWFLCELLLVLTDSVNNVWTLLYRQHPSFDFRGSFPNIQVSGDWIDLSLMVQVDHQFSDGIDGPAPLLIWMKLHPTVSWAATRWCIVRKKKIVPFLLLYYWWLFQSCVFIFSYFV